MPERDVHLLLSPKAAGILKDAIEEANIHLRHEEDSEEILTAIYNELYEQLPRKPKTKSKRKSSVMDVPCPKCLAKVGGRCVNPNGAVAKGFHKVRTQAFREAQ